MLHRLLKLKVFGAIRLLSSSTARFNQAFGGIGASVLVDRPSLPSLVRIKGSSRPLSGSAAHAYQDVAPSSSDLFRGYNELRVTNFPANMTEELLHDYFSRFGTVLSCKVMRNRETMESRRIAYLKFASKEEFDKVFAAQPHVINGEMVGLCPVKELALLLEGLSPATTKESLRAHFSGYRSFIRCVVNNNQRTDVNNAFVAFSSEEEFNIAISRPNVIDGKKVDVRIAPPMELTLFVGRLSPATTSEGLRAHFSRFGSLLLADVKQDRETGESRCFGYVTFSSQQELDSALKAQPHLIDGKNIVLNYRTGEFQLFVAGPSLFAISEDRLKEYFEQFGPVFCCDIARDKSTNRPLNHGWIGCSSQEMVDHIMELCPHSIDGEVVRVNLGDKRRDRECTLFVGRLPIGTTEEMLYDAFSRFGRIISSRLSYDTVTGRFKRFGFVYFDAVEGVRNALAARPHVINGVMVDTEASEKDRI